MVPSDDDLNRAMATATGWSHDGLCWISPKGKTSSSLPLYCTDRNTLPEILDAIRGDPIWSFSALLEKGRGSKHPIWFGLELPMHEIVVAALKSLGKWDETWENEDV